MCNAISLEMRKAYLLGLQPAKRLVRRAARFKALAVLFAASIVLGPTLSASHAEAADCAAVRMHLAVAKQAFVNARVYLDDGESAMARASWKAGHHEMGVAREIGKPEECLNTHDDLDFMSLSFQNDVYTVMWEVPEAAPRLEKVMAHLLGRTRRADNPQAYDAMKRSVASMHVLAKSALAGFGKATLPPQPTCERPSVNASILHVVEPETPLAAKRQGIQGVVIVDVNLDATGKPTNAVVTSSPSALLNEAAIHAAMASTFSPEVRDCKAVPTSYHLVLDFISE